jgi:hypothetical protein
MLKKYSHLWVAVFCWAERFESRMTWPEESSILALTVNPSVVDVLAVEQTGDRDADDLSRLG